MRFKTLYFCLIALLSLCLVSAAQAKQKHSGPPMVPDAPHISAESYVLMDANSGDLVASKAKDKHVKPASLTKMMTLYLVFDALKSGQISLDDKVTISKKAWKTGGSKMFLKEGNQVTVRKLIKGVTVASGNDACVALAEYVGGTEETFVQLMNHAAAKIGMADTHFTDPTGLPHPEHYSSAHDMAKLAQALIQDFPDYYHWFDEKWIVHNDIKQSNRNRLLWHDKSVDGIKTGHTENAGFCLTASAKRNGMRLVSVVMDTPSENGRLQATESLLNYGFRFYDTHLVYNANQTIHKVPTYYGQRKDVAVGLEDPLYVTLPKGEYKNIKVTAKFDEPVNAPLYESDSIGTLVVKLRDKVITERELLALQPNPRGGAWSRFLDYLNLTTQSLFS